jgi:sugar phosphate isomerase/epimerase
MGDYKIDFYGGSSYGIKPDDSPDQYLNQPISHGTYASTFSIATDPRTANQIKMTTEKINTGVKAVEVSMLTPDVSDSIPDQHLTELRRLKKLAGIDLTVHGPLIEPTGVIQNHWDETQRVQAERQIFETVKRAQRVSPEENLIVTLHASNGLPEPETWIVGEDGKKRLDNITVIEERSGSIGRLPKPKADYLEGSQATPEEELKRLNKDNWTRSLSNVSITASRATDIFDRRMSSNLAELKEGGIEKVGDYLKALRSEEGQKFINSLQKDDKQIANEIYGSLSYANAFVTDSYNNFKELFNQAYEVASKEDPKMKGQLDSLKEEIKQTIDGYKKDPTRVMELSEVVTKGIQTLEKIDKIPEVYKNIKNFAVEKSAETFGNVAYRAFQDAQSRGEKAPIISIENPPAGMGLTRAEDLKDVIEKARTQFTQRAVKTGMSESEAKEKAEQLIGATWDVGHINMIRKYGFTEKDLKEETKTIAPYVKHMHLSDNFGMEHTELPMGMGNVPLKAHLEELQKGYKGQFDKLKKVIEVGNWYQHFQTTPFSETLAAFGSPIYGMKMSNYWNQSWQNQGGYFAGYGVNPDIHHSIYGAGFSNLPVELGGQVGGRSRMSGNPME